MSPRDPPVSESTLLGLQVPAAAVMKPNSHRVGRKAKRLFQTRIKKAERSGRGVLPDVWEEGEPVHWGGGIEVYVKQVLVSGDWRSLEDDIALDMLTGCTGRRCGRARGSFRQR